VAAAVTVSATASRSDYADASYFQVDRHSIPCGDVDWTGRRPVPVLRVACSPDLGRIAVDPEVRHITDAAVSVLERDLGAKVEQPDFQLPYYEETFGAVIAADTDLTGLRDPRRAVRRHDVAVPAGRAPSGAGLVRDADRRPGSGTRLRGAPGGGVIAAGIPSRWR
jgi:hypothetical protein